MALQKNIEITKFNNLEVPNTYIKLAYVAWSNVDQTLKAHFSVWANSASEANGENALDLIVVDVSTAYPNLQADMYKEIKKLAKYADAIDV